MVKTWGLQAKEAFRYDTSPCPLTMAPRPQENARTRSHKVALSRSLRLVLSEPSSTALDPRTKEQRTCPKSPLFLRLRQSTLATGVKKCLAFPLILFSPHTSPAIAAQLTLAAHTLREIRGCGLWLTGITAFGCAGMMLGSSGDNPTTPWMDCPSFCRSLMIGDKWKVQWQLSSIRNVTFAVQRAEYLALSARS